MSKSKSSKGDVAKLSKKDSKKAELSVVREGRVTKPAQTPKAKSKEIAKSAAANHGVKEKLSKKAKKVPTPSPEPESESESESDSSEASDSDEDSSSSSASNSEDEKVVTKTPAKANGVPKPVVKAADTNDLSDSSEEDSEEDSEDDSESETEETPAKSNGVKTNSAAKLAPKDDTSDESASSEDESEDEKPSVAVNGTAASTKANGVTKKEAASSDEDSDDSEADSDDDSDDSSEASETEVPSKKRKAEAAATPMAKKSKTEEAGTDGIKNLFVGNLSWNIDEEWLSREFDGFGEITGCRIITDKNTGKAKGFGYVEFATAAAAKAALDAKNGAELDGRPMNVDFSAPRSNDAGPKERTNDRANRFGDKKSDPSDTLFIGNISFDATNEMVSETFQEFGTITRVSLPTDKETGNPKGFGYVGFSSVDEAKAALEALNGANIAGRSIRLDFAQPRSDDSPRGGGFSGGRGRGRGSFGGDRGGRGRGRGSFGDRGGRGRGGSRGGSYNRGGFGDFKGTKVTF
ncbi:RNA-binding domain-containing protein [Lepidopterella palustris CBS 459.81]|uniref:RNA-binding domain-containing protein n=1 Tax=Lepidopterella palustris CBS 459.81 TaxID=1314670 RepID=A0A8E2E2N4_9PEZI|nr:RNA-binding domain-containing protein [Lepidopterella palustris CBS 459.81]